MAHGHVIDYSSEAWWYLSTVHNDQNDLAVISHDSCCSVCGWGYPPLVREIQMEWRNTCRSGGMLACLSVGLKK